jgi:hypothetical protein
MKAHELVASPAEDLKPPESAPQTAGRWLYDHRRVMGMLAFACFCVVVAVVWADAGPWILIVKELGYAGLISVFLYFTVEQYARDRHQEGIDKNMKGLEKLQTAIVTDTLNTFYDRNLPPPAKQAIERLLLHPTVIREKLRLEIAFEWSQGREAVRIAIVQSYTLSNIAGHGEQTFELLGSDDIASNAGAPPGREIQISDAPIKVGHGKDYRVSIADDRGNFTVILDDRAKVQLKESATMSRQTAGREVFRIGVLTYDVKVSITHPEDLVPKMVLSAVHNSDSHMRTDHRRADWAFDNEVLLPGHTLILAWAPAPGD